MRTRLALGLTVSILLIAPSAAFASGRPASAPPAQDRADTGQRDRGSAAHSPHGPVLNEDTDDDGVGNCPDPQGDADNRHPSGRDRHCEAGDSGAQGRSASDPDGGANGGLDKPGGRGGVDPLDQDGNNGCGNDDDFEDDNNGACLGPVRLPHYSPPQPGAPVVEPSDQHRPRSVSFLALVRTAFEWKTVTADTQGLVGTGSASYLSPPGSVERGGTAVAASASRSRTAGVEPVRLASTGLSAVTLALIAFLTLFAGLALRSASRRVGGTPGRATPVPVVQASRRPRG